MNNSHVSLELAPADASLLAIFLLILVLGVIANTTLILAVSYRNPARRSPLLVGLCLADIFVCCVSSPITIRFSIFIMRPWPMNALWCKAIFFSQGFPVALSTMYLMMVSLERYVAIRHPTAASRYRHRRGIMAMITGIIWFTGFSVAFPILMVRHVTEADQCVEIWSSPEMRLCYAYIQLIVVYVIPCSVVLACHLAVRSQLTALSLTARAANGELPLPMPILRRPAHVIVIAGLPHTPDAKAIGYGPSDDDDDASTDESTNRIVETNLHIVPGVHRQPGCHGAIAGSSRGYSSGNRRGRRPRHGLRGAEVDIELMNRVNRRRRHREISPTPITSTLQSRRTLANTLLTAAVLFAGCWLPHVICVLYVEFWAPDSPEGRMFLSFTSLFGQIHSVVNPIMYWALNYQSLQNSCLSTTFFGYFRREGGTRNAASSTNEAALGPFHPRFIRPPPPRPPQGGRRNSSCYLY